MIIRGSGDKMNEHIEYRGPERRKEFSISEEVIEHIAERAAKKVLNEVYIHVGKSVIRKAYWIVGVGVTALAIFLAGKGFLK